MKSDALETGLQALAIELSNEGHDRLRAYLTLIAKWNKVHNLTAIRDPERMIVEHLLDSLAILGYVQPDRILDVGTGAGLPGIPLAIARPEWQVTLLDSNHKKCTFLRQALIELGLRNAAVVCERVEAYRPGPMFDTVASRAFAETQHFARVSGAFVAPGGVLLAMKGLYPHEEIAQLPAGVALKAVEPILVPGLDARRHIVIMTRA
jgi:16S rRNA (guanine527-N7)-methyltransferase